MELVVAVTVHSIGRLFRHRCGGNEERKARADEAKAIVAKRL
jgi:hypothetical protein